jgi:hypothetical protein
LAVAGVPPFALANRRRASTWQRDRRVLNTSAGRSDRHHLNRRKRVLLSQEAVAQRSG